MHDAKLAESFSASFYGVGARMLEEYKMRRAKIFGLMIVAALLAFELFNFVITDFALSNLFGDLRFFGVRWALILAIAFCGMGFAGIARLFTPEAERVDRRERTEVWYLLAAWFLAATMNAVLTWWGVSLALLSHGDLGNEILSREALLAVVPVFVAILIWMIRVLLIGLLSMAGERLFSHLEEAVRRGDPAAARRAQAGERLPVAAWAGSTAGQPAAAGARGARMIGGSAGASAPEPRRQATLAEQHAQRRTAQRPASQAPAVRPAPKPSAIVHAGGDNNGYHDLD
jgi:hypothetical protein